ncbi:hypothetical protein SAMN05421636_104485 [Pricia antarctica]|uniref:ATPase n=1 Tax=Pricia antarctica TaxID=641691 RepID=A0A1G7CAX8_9FLAO|nr:hypothetical protein [Pricia antarctica]SDE36373.1 hypothetical protein SAMN05421636_104485 [Pricia antarctica]
MFKKVFFKAAQKFHAQSDIDFDVDSKNKNFLGHFCRYWNQDPAFEVMENISLQKGLMVFGSCGTGKTSSFRIIQNLSKHYQVRELWFPAISGLFQDRFQITFRNGRYNDRLFRKSKNHP